MTELPRCLVVGTINAYSKPDWSYVHVDASDRPIYDLAQGRFRPVDLVADMRALPFADAVFDRVQVWHSLEHVNEAGGEQACREFHRVLKPGGTLDVCVPDLGGLSGPDIEASLPYVYGQQPGPNDIDPELQVHRWGYTEWTLRRLLQSVGFGPAVRVNDGDLHLVVDRA